MTTGRPVLGLGDGVVAAAGFNPRLIRSVTWTVLGPIIALIGLGLAIAGWRRR